MDDFALANEDALVSASNWEMHSILVIAKTGHSNLELVA